MQTQLDAIKDRLRAVYGVRGPDFYARYGRARRRMPRHLRKDGDSLLAARMRQGNPRLARQEDGAELRAAAERIKTYLDTIDLADLRKGRLLSLAGGIALNVLAALVLFGAALMGLDLI